jgi:O-antigen ligase
MIAKLLGPFLFLLTALAVIKSEDELRKMRNAILGSGALLFALAIYARAIGADSDPNASETGMAGLGPPSMGPAVFSAHMLPVAMLALAMFLSEPRTRGLVMLGISACAVIAALERSSAGALYLGFSIILFLGTRNIWRLLLPVLGVVGLPALMVFIPTFRRRMFFGDASSDAILADPGKALSSVNTSGRLELWDSALSKFFYPHPIIGSGMGSTQEYLYVHAGGGVVHSEYVRLLCEGGIVALVLFVLTLVSYSWRMLACLRSTNPSLRMSALAAAGAIVTYAVFCSTDNAFDYVDQFGIYVFALVGIAIKSEELVALRLHEPQQSLGQTRQLFPNLMR